MPPQSNDDKNKLYSFRITSEDEKDLTEYCLLESDLFPMASDDKFKRGIENLKNNNKSTSDWGTNYKAAATSCKEYIENIQDIDYIRSLAAYGNGFNQNLFAFENNGGIFNGGVCWWHSRFQRAALYLTYYLPNEPRPKDEQAKLLIKNLMRADRVLAIPGFANFSEFSSTYHNIIQKKLEQTQILEGIFLFAWINGLSGHTEVPPITMKGQMDAIYNEVNTNGIAYIKLQTPGIDSHAWLVTEMKTIENNGYVYKFIDSNNPTYPMSHIYNFGDIHIDMYGINMGVPYLQRSRELQEIKNIIAKFINQVALEPRI